ncbi:unnamed protein product, partial [Prorocentrum cordatum]
RWCRGLLSGLTGPSGGGGGWALASGSPGGLHVLRVPGRLMPAAPAEGPAHHAAAAQHQEAQTLLITETISRRIQRALQALLKAREQRRSWDAELKALQDALRPTAFCRAFEPAYVSRLLPAAERRDLREGAEVELSGEADGLYLLVAGGAEVVSGPQPGTQPLHLSIVSAKYPAGGSEANISDPHVVVGWGSKQVQTQLSTDAGGNPVFSWTTTIQYGPVVVLTAPPLEFSVVEHSATTGRAGDVICAGRLTFGEFEKGGFDGLVELEPSEAQAQGDRRLPSALQVKVLWGEDPHSRNSFGLDSVLTTDSEMPSVPMSPQERDSSQSRIGSSASNAFGVPTASQSLQRENSGRLQVALHPQLLLPPQPRASNPMTLKRLTMKAAALASGLRFQDCGVLEDDSFEQVANAPGLAKDDNSGQEKDVRTISVQELRVVVKEAFEEIISVSWRGSSSNRRDGKWRDDSWGEYGWRGWASSGPWLIGVLVPRSLGVPSRSGRRRTMSGSEMTLGLMVGEKIVPELMDAIAILIGDRKGYFTDPEASVSWADDKLWKRKIGRWTNATYVTISKRADRVVKQLPVDLQRKLEHLSDTALESSDGADAILAHLDVLSGERQGDERTTYQGARERIDAKDVLLKYEDVSSMNSECEMTLLSAIESKDLLEEEIPEVPALIQGERPKTWKRNRECKRQLKVDRKYFQRPMPAPGASDAKRQVRDGGNNRSQRGLIRERKTRLATSEITKRARCRKCEQKGRQGDECPNSPAQRPQAAAFIFLSDGGRDCGAAVIAAEETEEWIDQAREQVRERPRHGAMIVDAAVGQGLVGEPAMKKWELDLQEKGYRVARVPPRLLLRSSGGELHQDDEWGQSGSDRTTEFKWAVELVQCSQFDTDGQGTRESRALDNWMDMITLTFLAAVTYSREFLRCPVNDRQWTKRALKHMERLNLSGLLGGISQAQQLKGPQEQLRGIVLQQGGHMAHPDAAHHAAAGSDPAASGGRGFERLERVDGRPEVVKCAGISAVGNGPGLMFLRFAVEAAMGQIAVRRKFVLDHPNTSRSWCARALQGLMKVDGVFYALIDQCRFGLQVHPPKLAERLALSVARSVRSARQDTGALLAEIARVPALSCHLDGRGGC